MFVMSLFMFNNNENVAFAETKTGVYKGQKAHTFKLPSINGKNLELESFREGKTVLLVFGTTWCPSCKYEIPIIKKYYNEFKDDRLEVLNVYINESEKKVKSFVEKNQINYPVALDLEADIARLYKVIGIPLNIILDKDGIIKYRDNILPDKDDFKKILIN